MVESTGSIIEILNSLDLIVVMSLFAIAIVFLTLSLKKRYTKFIEESIGNKLDPLKIQVDKITADLHTTKGSVDAMASFFCKRDDR
jgi:hypothetical protein